MMPHEAMDPHFLVNRLFINLEKVRRSSFVSLSTA
jgi:hypothetical protein